MLETATDAMVHKPVQILQRKSKGKSTRLERVKEGEGGGEKPRIEFSKMYVINQLNQLPFTARD
jgi:hypothetical protein